MTNAPRPQISTDESYLERSRDLIKSREPLEEIPFELLTNALTLIGIPGDIYKDVTATRIPDEVPSILDKAYTVLSSTVLSTEQLKAVQKLWDYLCGADALEKADLIFVFGGISQAAVKEAIRLKLENNAPYILFSGKRAVYMTDETTETEAEQYQRIAIENGVAPKDILVEKDSVNTVENAVNSGVLLRNIKHLPKSIIAVSLPYHMKRASLYLRAGLGMDFKLIRHPGPSAKYTRDNFYKDEKGWQYVANEFIKLYMSRQGGHF